MSGIDIKEYATRRSRVRRALRGAAGLVIAGSPLGEDYRWRPHGHFEYLTGVADEPGAMLLLDPGHPVAARREVLLLAPRDPEREQWEGLRLPISSTLRDRTGIATIHRTGATGRLLQDVAPRAKALACLHPPASIDAECAVDLATWRKVADRTPGIEIVDRSSIIPALRAVKSPAEVRMIQRAADITCETFATAIAAIKPGMREREVQSLLEHGYVMGGGGDPAFSTIVGSGLASTVLHYDANDAVIEDGTLICIDSGARFGAYGADVSRTVPANGRFTKRQRAVYDVVLAAHAAATRTVRPGAVFAEVDAAARAIIVKAGFGDTFIHGIGHHLGLETHDTCGSGALKVGAVITIEPGIYLPDEGFGIRIEDDVVVTAKGRRVLTRVLPREADAIEALMEGGRRGGRRRG